MSTYPERSIAKRFSQDIFPSSVGFGCKGSEKFAIVQIFQLEVYGLKFIVKDFPNVIRQVPHNTASECYRGPRGLIMNTRLKSE